MPGQWDKRAKHIAVKLGTSPYMVRRYARLGALGKGAREICRRWFFNEALIDEHLEGKKQPMKMGRPRKDRAASNVG